MSVFGGGNDDTPSLNTGADSESGPDSDPGSGSDAGPSFKNDSIASRHVPRASVLDAQRSESSTSEYETDNSDAESFLLKPKSRKEVDAFRRWHARENHLIDAFEIARAGDLRHNLMGFVSERQINQSNKPAKNVQPWAARHRWTTDEKHRLAQPPSHWTAWPLLPGDVPSSHETFGALKDQGHRGIKRRRTTAPSVELEEALCDFTIHKARWKWEVDCTSSYSSTEGDQEVPPTSPNPGVESLAADDITSAGRASTRVESESMLSFSLDQQRSHSIVQPSVRSIMSQVDALLMGLYHSRICHRAHRNSKQMDRTGPESVTTSVRSSSTGEKKGSIGLRDWSDVLGMASLTGWDPGVVGRATERCAKLFGEGMSFTTLDADTTTLEHVTYLPHGVLVAEGDEEEKEGKWTLETLLCPHGDCPRHMHRFDLKRRLRWHIKDAHHWDPETENRPPKTVGGVHIDGFMQEIPARQGWRSRDRVKSEKRGVKRRKGYKQEAESGITEGNPSDES